MATNLSISIVKSAKPKEMEYLLSDGRQGLYLRVLPTGAKSWLYKYKIDGKARKLSLGQFPEIGLADARDKHAAARLLVRKGIDPAEPVSKHVEPDEHLSVKCLSELYIEGSSHLAANTLAETIRTLNKYVLPAIGSRPANSIRRPDAISLVEKYSNTPGQARAIMKISRAMFTFALHREIVDFNPFAQVTAAVPAIKARAKTRALSDEEIQHIWASLLKQKDPRSLATRRALIMILVTAQRPEEVTEMAFGEISIGVSNKIRCKLCRRCGWWTIPWQRLKTREVRQEDQKIYLTPLALQLIDSGASANLVFPNFKGISITRKALSHYVRNHESFGLARWTPHDLRRTAATGLSRLGCSDEIIDAILNHAKKGVIGVYNQNKYEKEKEEWLTIWADHLLTITSNNAP